MPDSPRSHVELDRPLARRIGSRIRALRLGAGLTQLQLAQPRYTKAYVSALENGLVKPSMAALHFLAGRLGVPVTQLLDGPDATWARLQADVALASGDWLSAADRYAALLPDASGAARAEILSGSAEALCRLERADEAVTAATEAVDLFEAAHRPPDAAMARYWQAFALYLLEQGDQAERLVVLVLDEVEHGLKVEPDLPARCLIALAMIASRDEEPERALAFLEQARARLDGLDDRRRATYLFSLAISYRELGDVEGAIRSATQSLAFFRAASVEREAAALENELALAFLALGRTDRAREHAEMAERYCTAADDERLQAHVTETRAQIALADGDVDDAVRLAREALRYAVESNNHKAQVSAGLSLARAVRSLGETGEASRILEDAAAIAREHGRRAQLQAVLADWAEVLAELGDLPRAFAVSQEALRTGRHERPAMVIARAPERSPRKRSSR